MLRRHNVTLSDELGEDVPSKSLNVQMSGHVNVMSEGILGGKWFTMA